MALERTLTLNKLTPRDRSELEAAAKRREVSQSRAASLLSSKGEWQDFVQIMRKELDLMQRYREIKDKQSELASSLHLTRTIAAKDSAGKRQRVEELIADTKDAEVKVLRALELLRARTAQRLPSFGPYGSYQKLVKFYTMSLAEERLVTTPYRNTTKAPHERDLYDDLDSTWRQWEDVVNGLYTQVARAQVLWEKDVRSRLEATGRDLDRYEALDAEIIALNAKLENTLNHNALALLNDYQQELEQRQARSTKWQDDLEWLAYGQTRDQNIEAQKQIDLEKQILNDNLRNLEQGATLPWR